MTHPMATTTQETEKNQNQLSRWRFKTRKGGVATQSSTRRQGDQEEKIEVKQFFLISDLNAQLCEIKTQK